MKEKAMPQRSELGTENPFLSGLIDTFRHRKPEEVVELIVNERNKETLMSLSNSGIKLLCYIMTEAEPHNDFFYLDRDLFMEQYRIESDTTVRTAIADLVYSGIIAAASRRGYYWINPRVLRIGAEVEQPY